MNPKEARMLILDELREQGIIDRDILDEDDEEEYEEEYDGRDSTEL